jgi:acetyl-CoA C-acetyltransferase
MSKPQEHAYLLAGTRTPFGRFGGQLAGYSALALGAMAIRKLVDDYPIARQPSAAMLGVVVQAGLGQNPARIAAIEGGISMTAPAITLNNVCLAGLEAVCDATRRIRLNEGSHYVVGGFDSMTNAPHLVCPNGATEERKAFMFDGLTCALSGQSMGVLSDACNAELGISREAQDHWAYHSHMRALRAREILAEVEILPLEIDAGQLAADQGVRPGTSLEALAKLQPAFTSSGTITAGNSSQMADGASAGIIANRAVVDAGSTEPLARIVDWAFIAGPDSTLHLKPAVAMQELLKRQGLKPAQIDLFEINEAFAGVALASCLHLGLPHELVNVNGGAIALGHPLGGTGFRLLLTLALEMKRRGVRRGIATLCGGGGQGLAVLIERN